MNGKVRFKEEIGFLETWDQVRKQITNDQCEMQEFGNMLDKLTHDWESAMKNCKPKNCETYNALYGVLHEEVVNKKLSTDIGEPNTVVDSGFGTFRSESPTECNSKLATSSLTDVDQRITLHRSKRIRRRPRKILLRNMTHDAAAIRNAFNSKINVAKQFTNTYPYMVTVVMCFACLIAFMPHHFFPWFFIIISFNSPPPL